jgi:aspartate 1-decarboxylase
MTETPTGPGAARRFMLRAKIHRVRVTGADPDYEGSITLDADLLDAADILPNEQVHVWNVTRGTRVITYAMVGDRGSGTACLNGAAAQLVQPGDIVIVAAFTDMDDAIARSHQPRIILVDEHNRIRQVPAQEIPGPRRR